MPSILPATLHLYQVRVLVQNASETYIEHTEVQGKYNAARERASNYLARKLKDAIAEAESLLSGEAQESLRQREVGEVGNLQVFEQARAAVKAVWTEIWLLPAEAILRTLQVEQANAQAFLDKIKAAEERRADLRVKYQKLEKLLEESKLDQAKADYESLPGDYKVDPELDSLFRTRIEPFFGEEDHWKNAQRLFADGKWSECVATLEHIASTSPLAEPAADLRMRAALNQLHDLSELDENQSNVLVYEAVLKQYDTYAKASQSWRQADELLQRSRDPKINPVERLQLLKQAASVYPQHKKLEQELPRARNEASGYLASKIKKEVGDAKALLDAHVRLEKKDITAYITALETLRTAAIPLILAGATEQLKGYFGELDEVLARLKQIQ